MSWDFVYGCAIIDEKCETKDLNIDLYKYKHILSSCIMYNSSSDSLKRNCGRYSSPRLFRPDTVLLERSNKS